MKSHFPWIMEFKDEMALSESEDFSAEPPSTMIRLEKNDSAPVITFGQHESSVSVCGGVNSTKLSDSASSFDVETCPVCGDSMTGLGALRRKRHVNRCDVRSKQSAKLILSRTKASPLVSSIQQSSIHNCPCCRAEGFALHELESHLQECGLANRSESAYFRQSRDAPVTNECASPAEILSSNPTKPSRPLKKQRCLSLKALKKLDEGTQVALALSASMQPEAPSRRGRGNPAKSKLKFTRPPPALIERDPADSVKIVADRVAAIISRTSISSESLSSDLPVSKLNSSDEHTPEAKKKMWSLSEKLETEMLDSFYVSALQPPLSPMKEDADFRFRSLTLIPGFKLALDTSQRAVKDLNHSANAPVHSDENPRSGTSLPTGRKLVKFVSSSDSEDAMGSTHRQHENMVAKTSPSNLCESNDESDMDDDNRTLMLGSDSDREHSDEETNVLPFTQAKPSPAGEKVELVHDPYRKKLDKLSDTKLHKKLESYGVKPLKRSQALAFLMTVHKMSQRIIAPVDKPNVSLNEAAKISPKKKRTKPRARKKVVDGEAGPPVTAVGTGPDVPVIDDQVSAGSDVPKKRQKRPTTKSVEKKIRSKVSLEDNCGSAVSEASRTSAMCLTSANNPQSSAVPVKAAKSRAKKMKPLVQLVSSSSDKSDKSDEDGSPLEQQNLPSDLDMLPAKLKKLKTPEEVETTLTNYLQNHPVLYEQILQFEVIYLKPFLKKLKEDGWMVKPVLLMDFFDSQGIAFSQHNAERPRPWGGKKTTVTKK